MLTWLILKSYPLVSSNTVPANTVYDANEPQFKLPFNSNVVNPNLLHSLQLESFVCIKIASFGDSFIHSSIILHTLQFLLTSFETGAAVSVAFSVLVSFHCSTYTEV